MQVTGFKAAKLTTNAAMCAKQVPDCCKLDSEGRGYIGQSKERMNFPARGHSLEIYREPVFSGSR